jgi:hypothetical protein
MLWVRCWCVRGRGPEDREEWLRRKQTQNIAFYLFNSLAGFAKNVNGTGAVYYQKTSKFFVSHHKESMEEHVGIKGVY